MEELIASIDANRVNAHALRPVAVERRALSWLQHRWRRSCKAGVRTTKRVSRWVSRIERTMDEARRLGLPLAGRRDRRGTAPSIATLMKPIWSIQQRHRDAGNDIHRCDVRGGRIKGRFVPAALSYTVIEGLQCKPFFQAPGLALLEVEKKVLKLSWW